MKALLFSLLMLMAGIASAQQPSGDLLDSLGLGHLKDYSALCVSSNNRYVFSNDDSKRIMSGETLHKLPVWWAWERRRPGNA